MTLKLSGVPDPASNLNISSGWLKGVWGRAPRSRRSVTGDTVDVASQTAGACPLTNAHYYTYEYTLKEEYMGYYDELNKELYLMQTTETLRIIAQIPTTKEKTEL